MRRVSDMTTFVAVDAGNTKVDALAITRDGTVEKWTRAGCGDIYGPEGEGAAVAQVRLAIEAAAGRELTPDRVPRVSLRLAGLDWPEDFAFWEEVLASQWQYRGEFSLANDGFASLRLGFLDAVALAITAGTGVAIAARNGQNETFSLGMWGPHDMGAKGLGISGYRSIALSHLGMGPSTILSEMYAQLFNVSGSAELVHYFSSRERRPFKQLLARAAPLVTAAALDGDTVARGIVNDQATLLFSYARAVAIRVGFNKSGAIPIVLSGQILRSPGSRLTSILTRLLEEEFPRAQVRLARLPAVCGAALDVLAEAGVTLSEQIVHRMSETIPTQPEVVEGPPFQ